MTQEEKELLLKDLSSRLPYGVVVELDEKFRFNKGTRPLVKELLDLYCVEGMKPYLRPILSMTEEEKKELLEISNFNSDVDDICYDYICCIERTSIDIADIANFISWLNAHHFDYRGLIERGLAIEVTESNNPYEE